LGNLVSFGRSELDVSHIDGLKHTLIEIKPDLIINASAYTEVDRAETEPDATMKINAQAPGSMAETARKLGAVLIHYSTDYVFDGKKGHPYTENDSTNPLNMYGKSKLKGEEYIQQAGDVYLILRTSWVYSMRGNSFVNKVLRWARKNETLKIVSDQIGNPTWARALAETTNLILFRTKSNLFETIREKHGIYHLAGSGYTSRYEWAKQILANDPSQTEQLVQSIEPISSNEFPTPALRPLFTALDCAKVEENFGLRLPSWEESLRLAMTE
jgi:dTDP-4-dehydrorhamnose reductase